MLSHLISLTARVDAVRAQYLPIPRVQIYSTIEDTSGVLSVVAVLFDSAVICPGYLEGFLERSVLAACLASFVSTPFVIFAVARVTAWVTVVNL